MKKICAALLILVLLMFGTAAAKIYRYVDDKGQVYFTNDLSTVPADKLDGVTVHEEYISTAVPPSPAKPQPRVYEPAARLPSQIQAERRARLKEKEKLESEYNALIKEKEALDNDKSFQKRRKKRKYKHRPYIQDLIKKEKYLNQRLAELENELKPYEKMD